MLVGVSAAAGAGCLWVVGGDPGSSGFFGGELFSTVVDSRSGLFGVCGAPVGFSDSTMLLFVAKGMWVICVLGTTRAVL